MTEQDGLDVVPKDLNPTQQAAIEENSARSGHATNVARSESWPPRTTLGSHVKRAERARWGFNTPTQVLTLATGVQVVAQRLTAPEGAARARRVRTAVTILGAAGIPVPDLLGCEVIDGEGRLLFRYVPGTGGAELVDDPVEGLTLASLMGAILMALRRVRADALAPNRAWSSAARLAAASVGWQAAAPADLLEAVQRAVAKTVAADWRPTASHGDFVPANVLVADGRIAAVLDLSDVSAGHPLLDAAWWGLIVRYHHPRRAQELLQRLLATGGLGATERSAQALACVASVRALELLAATRPGPARVHAQLLLQAALRWLESGWQSGRLTDQFG